MKRVMLYFGSFNPIHKGHTALAEYVLDSDLCDEVVLVVSPQSPYQEAAAQAPEMDRFEMAEIACAASKYPEKIKPSVIEFLLPKPSYTIDTLRYLEENFGGEMRFSILMGGDQIARLDGWKEYERILEYPIYVYPRRDARTERFAGRYYEEVGVGVRFYADDLERSLLDKGLSPSQASSFDGSAAISSLSRREGSVEEWTYALRVNDTVVRECRVEDLPHTPERLIAGMSRYYMLKIGDFIYCGGFPRLAVRIGDRLRLSLNGTELLDFGIK